MSAPARGARSIRGVRVLLDVSAVPERPVGAGRYTVALASGLAARTEVELHLLSRRDDQARWDSDGRRRRSCTVRRRAGGRSGSRGSRPAVRRLAARLDVDVWHGPHYTMPLRAGVPSVVTIHDLTFFDHPEWHERSKVVFFRRMIRAAAHRATVLVCVSSYTAERLRALVDPRGEVVVAHHGVDHDRFVAIGDDAADLSALAAHGIEPPYIAFASTIEPRKNVPTLVRAFARVAASRPELRLVLAGSDGWGAREARDAIAASGVATRVIRPGYLPPDTVPALFRQAAVVAYPSFEEGFGLPALEGLACGAPVVTTAGSALEEVVGDAALLVPPDDPAALAAAIAHDASTTPLSRRDSARPARRAPRRSRGNDASTSTSTRTNLPRRPGSARESTDHRRPRASSATTCSATAKQPATRSWRSTTTATSRSTSPTARRLHASLARHRPEVVYHLAALSHVGESWGDPTAVLRVNVEGTAHRAQRGTRRRRAAAWS